MQDKKMVKKFANKEEPFKAPLSEDSKMDVVGSPAENFHPEIELVIPPEGGWGWVIVVASFICNFLVDGIIFSGGILSKHIQKEFQASDRQVAPVNSLLAGFYLLGGPFVSVLANKYGFRVVTIIGSFISSAAFALSYFATSVEYLYLTYGVIGGLGFCMIYMPAVLIVGFYFERWRALATGLALCGSGVGTFVLAPLTDILIDNFGWRVTVVIHGGFVLICVICGAMFRPIKPITLSKDKDESFHTLCDKLESRLLSPNTKLLNQAIPRNYSDVTNNYYCTTEGVQDSNKPGLIRCASTNAVFKDVLGNKAVLLCPTAIKKENQKDSKDNIEHLKPLIGITPMVLHPNADVGKNFLNRDDIFYSGSLKRLPQYTSGTSVGYRLAMTHDTKKKDALYESPKTVGNTLASMLDFKLFRSPTFIILTISGFFTMLGLFVPYMFVTLRAEDNGINKTISVLLVSTLGAANIIGRVASGVVSSMPKVSPLWLNNIALTVGGIATIVSGLYYYSAYQFGYCVVFGLAIACFASLRPILVVEYIGLDKLTSCFGLFLLFQGLGALLGSPIAGALIDLTHDYDMAFYVSGGCLLISAVILYPVDCICRWEKARNEKMDENRKLNKNYLVI